MKNVGDKSSVQNSVQAKFQEIRKDNSLLRNDIENVRKKEKENRRAITEIGLLLIISVFVNICMFALLFFIVLKG